MLSGLQKIASLANVVQLNNANKRDDTLLDNKPNNILISPEALRLNTKEEKTDDKNKVTPIFIPVDNYSEKILIQLCQIRLKL